MNEFEWLLDFIQQTESRYTRVNVGLLPYPVAAPQVNAGSLGSGIRGHRVTITRRTHPKWLLKSFRYGATLRFCPGPPFHPKTRRVGNHRLCFITVTLFRPYECPTTWLMARCRKVSCQTKLAKKVNTKTKHQAGTKCKMQGIIGLRMNNYGT